MRLEDEVFPVGGPDKYLKEKYPDQASSKAVHQPTQFERYPSLCRFLILNVFFQASLLGFATWLEESFETDDRTCAHG